MTNKQSNTGKDETIESHYIRAAKDIAKQTDKRLLDFIVQLIKSGDVFIEETPVSIEPPDKFIWKPGIPAEKQDFQIMVRKYMRVGYSPYKGMRDVKAHMEKEIAVLIGIIETYANENNYDSNGKISNSDRGHLARLALKTYGKRNK